MRILLIAPHPFYQERGTPIASRLLCEALCEAGHRVDMLTYPEGTDVVIPGLRIHRIPSLPGMRNIPIGFSFKKLLCDFFVFWSMIWLLSRQRYDVVHANEESVFLALLLKPFHRKLVVYDMDSSMAEQLMEKWAWLRHVRWFLEGCETLAFRHADVVMAVCDDLASKVRRKAPGKKVVVVEDVALPDGPEDGNVDDLRVLCGRDCPMILYVGNLEPYQGIDLLVDAVSRLPVELMCRVIVIGGSPQSVTEYAQLTVRKGIGDRVLFLGARPVRDLNRYLSQADILVSPRIKGKNTPMKVYSYLASGKALLATRIRSHTQAMDERSACLVDPDPEAMAAGLVRLLQHPDYRRALGAEGAALARERYSMAAFCRKVSELYVALERGSTKDQSAPEEGASA